MKNDLLKLALSQIGVKEESGFKHNPIILDYFKEIGHEWVETDETAWCSAFVNWCAMKCGLNRSNRLDARSWLKIGTVVNNIESADIVVFWRESPDSWKGHVGIPICERDGYIYTLGGNQKNSVCIDAYKKNRKLAYIKLD